MIVGRSHPQAQDIRAILFHYFLREDAVAQGFGHLASLAVHYPAMGNNRPVRRAPSPGDGGQQGGLEPATVLIRAFQIQIGRPVQFFALIAHRRMAHARIKPYVHNVFFLVKAAAAALGAHRALRQDFLRLLNIPLVGSLLAEQFRNCQHCLFGDQWLAAVPAIEDRDGHAPPALPGNTPVLAVENHRSDAVLSPSGNPGNIVNGCHSFLFKILYRAEPLLGGTEQNGILTPPAVRVLVHDFLHRKQGAGFLQMLGNGLAGRLRIHSRKAAGLSGQNPVIVYRYNHRQIGIVAVTDVKVLHAVPGSRVYASRTAFQGT